MCSINQYPHQTCPLNINVKHSILPAMVGVGVKPGLWTLDWTMDWTLDWTSEK